MAPLPEDNPHPQIQCTEMKLEDLKDDDIVITGMSGTFPDCHSVYEFSDKLYNKVNMVSSEKSRWKFNHPEVSEYCGIVPALEKFDAQFFMIHYRLGNSMDGMPRKLMEHAYQAIYDAGINPHVMSGNNTGVFVGTGMSETEKVCSYAHYGFGIVGCNRSMFSNRISYWLNARGPSMTIDAACSGAIISLEKAYEAMQRGECDSAIVGGASLNLHPQTFIHCGRLLAINPDGKTKCFSKNADGLSQSEAISVIFLQRYKDAKRVYAKVIHAKSEYIPMGDGESGFPYGPYRPLSVTTTFLNKFYKEANISPKEVEYVEAFGSAQPEADKAELEAIETIFCDGREKQLNVGSVISNMGYSDAACGIAALTKVCLGFHKGAMAANLNCETPRDDIKAIREGKMTIPTENLPFERSYVAINNVSVTGVNAHALLKGVYKAKDIKKYQSAIPHLVTVSGRQESAVQKILNDIKSRPIDPEEIALFHNIHKYRISKHMARGFTILATNDANETVSICEKADYYDEAKRPLWFVYSGMGSQWTGMGTQLMKIPVFAEAIQRCHKVLEPKGIDLIHILTADDKTIYDNILNSFVGIAAVQIGLTDVLKALEIVPDKLIGHSVGELGCAYADGCLTADEMILSAYSRGLVSVQIPFIRGSMAAVGIGYQQVKSLCPPEIEVACHNGPESSTISGPADDMKDFVASLTAKGIFAREVPCSNIAYHSRYIKEAGPGLLQYLSDVIKTPKERSSKWLSTSVPQDKWELPAAKYSSAEYHTNNLLSPVLFEETARLIPSNAVLIEVAPHGLLQAILKRSLSPNCFHVPLTRRGHADNSLFLLEAVGKLFMQGYDPDVSQLYPKIQFPVSTETRPISHLVQWVHTESWSIPLFRKANRTHGAQCNFSISIHDDEYQYLNGHVIDGSKTYPYGGILACVWDTLAMTVGSARKDLSVQFRDVQFLSQPKLLENVPLQLNVEIHKGSGKFEVSTKRIIICRGVIIAAESKDLPTKEAQSENDETLISSDDIYRILYEKGYQYSGEFRGINNVNTSLNRAQMKWTGNWVTFLESVIQMSMLQRDEDTLIQPNFIGQLVIDVKRHRSDTIHVKDNGDIIDADFNENKDMISCGGVILENINFEKKTLQQRQTVAFKFLKFIPFFQKDVVDIPTALYLFMQMISENIDRNSINALEISGIDTEDLSTIVTNVMTSQSELKVNVISIGKEGLLDPKNRTEKPDVVLINNSVMDRKVSEDLYHVLPHDIFIIVLEESPRLNSLYKVVSSTMTPRGRMVLARWRPSTQTQQKPATVVSITSAKDLLLLHATRQKLHQQERLVVLTTYPPFNGLKDLIKKYRTEPQRNKIYLTMVDEKTFPSIQGKPLPEFDLTFNILSKGTWGGEFFVQCEDQSSKNRDVKLISPRDGDIDSLVWTEAPECDLQDGIGVMVNYTGLSYFDAKKATGEANLGSEQAEHVYGMDYSGMTKSGERVMGIVGNGSAASFLKAEPLMLWPVPAHWSLEDAATVPLAYAHAFYCLAIKSKMMPGMSILVHGATGGLGLAVISIALAHGCKIFATVGDAKKKRFLRKMFPEIPEEHIGNSRDVTFVKVVMQGTNGSGCKLIVSCVKGPLTDNTLFCSGDYGLTLDTHSLHSRDNFALGLSSLWRNRTYAPIDFSSIFTFDKREDMKKIQYMMCEGITRGYVRPLPRITYAWSCMKRAFTLLSAARHRGRVLLHHGSPAPSSVPRLLLSPKCSYVIISSDEDSMMTLRLADLLVSRGANRLILQFHNKFIGQGHLKMKIKSWQKLGVNVQVVIEKVTRKEQLTSLILDAKKLGSLEGVFVVSSEPSEELETEMVAVVTDLDNITKKLCPSLKHFAVITETSTFAQNVCAKRALEGLPAMLLRINAVEQFDEKDDSTSSVENSKFCWNAAIEALERALHTPQTVMVAHPKPVLPSTLLTEIAKIPGVSLKVGSSDNTTLDQLGIEEYGSQRLCEVFEKKFNLLIPKDKIHSLTISEIKLLQESFDQNKASEIISGLTTFFSEINTDELFTNTTTIIVPTLVQNSALREDEFDNSATYIVLVPGLDGLHSRFLSFAERLKLPAMVLQPGLDHPDESVREMADRFVKTMVKTLKPTGKFYLLGYSSGAIVALEMAKILEEKGLEGVIFCVDADPDSYSSKLDSWLQISQKGENRLQNELVGHIFKLVTGEDSEDLTCKLQNATKWNDKVEIFVGSVHGRVTLSAQYVRNTLETAYSRIQQAVKYSSQGLQGKKLRSQIVLLRSRCQFAEPNNLEQYSVKPLKLFDIQADHARALEDLRCTNIVNTHLDQSILDSFEKSNLCTTYLLNADNFIEFSVDFVDDE